MPKIDHQSTPKSSSVFLLVILVLGSFSDADDEQEARPQQTIESEGEAFTVMDIEAMNTYRDERRNAFVESLAKSTLSIEHQELVANAMAKMYVGVPVGSYTEAIRTHNTRDEPFESTEMLRVSVRGYIQEESLFFARSLDSNSPFKYFPSDPFVPETGNLLDESDETATFLFDLAIPIEDSGENDMLAEFIENMNWLFEITVNKTKQTPELVVIKLEKPVRKRFLFKLSSVQLKLHYSFIESCDCFAINAMNMEIKASALVAGRLDQSTEIRFTDIECKDSVQFLLPDDIEASFLLY